VQKKILAKKTCKKLASKSELDEKQIKEVAYPHHYKTELGKKSI
jgi:hypothetical protein